MKLTVTTFTSIDGVMQGPGSPDEDPTGGFHLGGWLVPFADDDMGRLIDATLAEADEILLGRTTYDMMQTYWSQVTDPDDDVAVALNTLPKHVATNRPDTLTWTNSHPIVGDLVGEVAGLKQRPGRELQVHGSHGLVQTLLTAGLVDRFNIWTFPVVVGDGKRLFGPGAAATTMRRLATEITSTGVVVTAYEPAGPLEQHAFVVEDGKESVRA